MTDLTPDERAEMRRLAEEVQAQLDDPGIVYSTFPGARQWCGDAEFITKCDPPTILRLLDALEQREAEVADLLDELNHPALGLARWQEIAEERLARAEAAEAKAETAARELRDARNLAAVHGYDLGAREALESAADEWATGAWNDAFLAGEVTDDVSAVKAMETWLRDRARAGGAG